MCGLGEVEGKFLKATVEKHPWGLHSATPDRGQLQADRGTPAQASSNAQHVYHKLLFIKLQSVGVCCV